MPIVAGMGGNAGTQVLALMVRGLALGQVGAQQCQSPAVEGSARRADQRDLGLVLGIIVLPVGSATGCCRW